jgi:hypothetical protein
MVRSISVALVGLVLAGAIGCSTTSKYSRRVASVDTEPGDEDVVVVFVRPAQLGYSMRSSVFECWDEERSELVGLISDAQKLVYRTTPGEHLFMVVGQNADFMHADLEAGKVYYVLVTRRQLLRRRMGFSLIPVRAADRPKLEGWLALASWVENTPASQRWARQNARDIERMRSWYYGRWRRQPSDERATLAAEDGLSAAQ